MNNKYIDNKLKEFREKFVETKDWKGDKLPLTFVWKSAIELEQFIKEALSQLEQKTRIDERAKHRDNGCKCMECHQDNINIAYNMQLKSEQELCGCEADEWGIEHTIEAHCQKPEEKVMPYCSRYGMHPVLDDNICISCGKQL